VTRVSVDRKTLTSVVRALKAESDGKALRRDLVRNLKGVAEPALQAVRASILSMPSHSHQNPGLRESVARATKVSIRTGSRAGVSIVTRKKSMPRDFRNAPKRLNSSEGWRHKVFGDPDRWVDQRGKVGWFDDTLKPFRAPGKEAALAALAEAAQRIETRAKRT
jgi:hypothetical protein